MNLKNFFKRFKKNKEDNLIQNLPIDKLSCYLTLQIDKEGETWVDWGWGETEECIFDFSQLLTKLSTGCMLDELVQIVKVKCLQKERPDLYATFLQIMQQVYAERGQQEQQLVEELEDRLNNKKAELHSPLVKPSEVIRHD